MPDISSSALVGLETPARPNNECVRAASAGKERAFPLDLGRRDNSWMAHRRSCGRLRCGNGPQSCRTDPPYRHRRGRWRRRKQVSPEFAGPGHRRRADRCTSLGHAAGARPRSKRKAGGGRLVRAPPSPHQQAEVRCRRLSRGSGRSRSRFLSPAARRPRHPAAADNDRLGQFSSEAGSNPTTPLVFRHLQRFKRYPSPLAANLAQSS